MIEADEHRSVTKTSYVVYSHAKLMQTRVLDQYSGGRSDDVSEELFRRVCNGLEESAFTTPRMLEFYKSSQS